MNLNLTEILAPSIIEGFTGIAIALLPMMLFILIPAIVLNMIFGNKEAWNLGALLGFVAFFTIGPEFSIGIF